MPTPSSFNEADIGNFDKPLVSPPAKKTAPPATGATATALDSSEAALAAAAREAQADLAPLERYEKALKELHLTREEAAGIVDDILMKGYWSKEMALTPRRKVKFRTRLYADIERFHNYIEAVHPKNPSFYNEILYRYYLAASLESYDTVVFEYPTRASDEKKVEELFQKRMRFVMDLGDPALRLLYDKLAKFDEIVTLVMQEGATENF